MSQPKDNLPSDDQLRDQANMVIAEALLPIVGGSLAAKGAEALAKKILSPNPVFVQVLDSKRVKDRHQVNFKLTNNTLHGVYLEKVSLSEPEGEHTVKPTSDPYRKRSYAFPDLAGNELKMDWLFELIRPGENRYFVLEFPLCLNRGPKTDWAGVLKLLISRLEEETPKWQEVRFRIRWNEQPSL
jgi:hypothetical protein